LKLQELYLVHEYQEKVYEEKEEQRRIREQMREEEISRREIERVLQEAERDEARYAEALRRAREDVEKTVGEKQQKLYAQIEELQRKLNEAQANRERAIARAQMTRSGHVYVISNIGSFGDDVFKIGMTRRLDPLDRVRELGDASVPFQFDVHAMIYAEDAPGLETKLHQIFHHRRVNLVNERREFFRVTIEEIAEAVSGHDASIRITRAAEAIEYRKTIAIRQNNFPKQERAPRHADFPTPAVV
jgi:multidrug efflux pump subunit AcrA (membrane-fusion protein)